MVRLEDVVDEDGGFFPLQSTISPPWHQPRLCSIWLAALQVASTHSLPCSCFQSCPHKLERLQPWWLDYSISWFWERDRISSRPQFLYFLLIVVVVALKCCLHVMCSTECLYGILDKATDWIVHFALHCCPPVVQLISYWFPIARIIYYSLFTNLYCWLIAYTNGIFILYERCKNTHSYNDGTEWHI
jgi:hypothetical protein